MPSSGHPSPSSFEVAEDEPFPLNSRLQVGEAKVVIAMSSSKDNAFVHDLEERLKERSDQLEEVHMEAAIDAELITVVDGGGNPVVSGGGAKGETQEAIFDDYTNINAVANCLSPYVPAAADRIDAFCRWVDLTSADVLLDIGCGDGRVCVVASRLAGCESIGLDVSPPCIEMAKRVANEERLQDLCQFHEADVTIHPDLLLSESSPIASLLKRVTVVFLYTYPTLLVKTVPLLDKLCSHGNVRAVVTLRYHLGDEIVEREDTEHEFQLYARMKSRNES